MSRIDQRLIAMLGNKAPVTGSEAFVPSPQTDLAPEVPREQAIAARALQALALLGFNVNKVLHAAEEGEALPESEVPAELNQTVSDPSALATGEDDQEVVEAIKGLLVKAGVEIVDDLAGGPSAGGDLDESDEADLAELNAISARLGRRHGNNLTALLRVSAHLTSCLNLIQVQACKSGQ